MYKTYVEDYNPGIAYWNNASYHNEYSDFVDAANLDFTLKEDAGFLTADVSNITVTDEVFGIWNESIPRVRIPFEKIGLVK